MKIEDVCAQPACANLNTVDAGSVVRLNSNGKLYIVAVLLEGYGGPFSGFNHARRTRRILVNLATGFAKPIENGERSGCVVVNATLKVC